MGRRSFTAFLVEQLKSLSLTKFVAHWAGVVVVVASVKKSGIIQNIHIHSFGSIAEWAIDLIFF